MPQPAEAETVFLRAETRTDVADSLTSMIMRDNAAGQAEFDSFRFGGVRVTEVSPPLVVTSTVGETGVGTSGGIGFSYSVRANAGAVVKMTTRSGFHLAAATVSARTSHPDGFNAAFNNSLVARAEVRGTFERIEIDLPDPEVFAIGAAELSTFGAGGGQFLQITVPRPTVSIGRGTAKTGFERELIASVWTLESLPNGKPAYPGSAPERALPSLEPEEGPSQLPFSEPNPLLERPDTSVDVSTEFLAPVVGGFGTVDRVFFRQSEPAAPPVTPLGLETPNPDAPLIGYSFDVVQGGSNFASFNLPGLASDQAYTITVGEQTFAMMGDQEIDFMTFDPLGVPSFFLSGLPVAPNEGFTETFGMLFASADTANFVVSAISVPEPNTLLIAGAALAAISRTRRSR